MYGRISRYLLSLQIIIPEDPVMKIRKIVSCLALLSFSPFLFGFSQASPDTAGALHVSGTRLCSSAGEPVLLRGISTHGLAWYPEYVNEDAFRQLHDEWGCNLIRLAMYTAEYGGYCEGGDQEALKELVRKGIRCAAESDMYVIVDWHILSDSNPMEHAEEAAAFFSGISGEFADADHILYEICNEPNGDTTWADIKTYAEKIIPVIRGNDPDAVILIGTPNWSQYVDQAAADPITGYDNLMYTLHFYAATHKDDLRNRLREAVSSGLPVFVSEFGICDASGSGAIDTDEADEWIRLLDELGISCAAWNLSNKDESSALLRPECSRTGGFTDADLSESGKWVRDMLKNSPDK